MCKSIELLNTLSFFEDNGIDVNRGFSHFSEEKVRRFIKFVNRRNNIESYFSKSLYEYCNILSSTQCKTKCIICNFIKELPEVRFHWMPIQLYHFRIYYYDNKREITIKEFIDSLEKYMEK